MATSSSSDYLEHLNVKKLREILKSRSLQVTGKKFDLIARLRSIQEKTTPHSSQKVKHRLETNDSPEATDESSEESSGDEETYTTKKPKGKKKKQDEREHPQQLLKIRELELKLKILKRKKRLDEPSKSEKNIERLIDISSIPRPEPPIFNGEPLDYPKWKSAFDTLIDRRNLPQHEKIFFLQKYISGKAERCIDGILSIGSDNAYERAIEVLEKRFGDKFRVGNAFTTKLYEWPSIKPRDSEALEEYSDFLTQCLEAKAAIPRLNKLDDCEEVLKLARKLPDWAKNKWSSKAGKLKDKYGDYPPFKDFVNFVNKEAELAMDPIISINALQEKPEKQKIVPSDKPKATTQLKSPVRKSTTYSTSVEDNSRCNYCNLKNHDITVCRSLNRLPHNEKTQFLHDNNLCFGCLQPGHRSSDCRERATCNKCSQSHPTSLHFDSSKSGVKESMKSTQSDSTKTMSAQDNSTTRTTQEEKSKETMTLNTRHSKAQLQTTMIVPVWMSNTRNPAKELLVYALIDTQSDTTFVLDSVASQVGNGVSATLSISTMTNSRKTSRCLKYSDIQVRGYFSEVSVNIPEAYTTENIPINLSHIPTQDTADKWSHLEDIKSKLAPLQECPVALLIGYNCSEASRPLSIVNGEPGEPYAIRTPLGWSVIGGPQQVVSHEAMTALQVTHRIRTKELVTKDEVLRSLEDNLYEGSQGKSSSQDDIKFLEIMKSHIRQENGFYTMPLPFKCAPEKPYLPNNRSYAITRLRQLKKKFKDENYYDKYKEFMDKMISNGEAVKVPEEDTKMASAWYIPHHGVTNPMKPGKMRIVYDCSSKFQGRSLNDCLLDGPDLSNNLIGVLHRFRQHKIAFTADIERMFYRFSIPLEDQDYLRFVWFDEQQPDKIVDYKLTVHVFGASSSPGCANYGFKQLAEDHKSTHSEAADYIQSNFYIDDGLKSMPTVEEAINLIKQTRELCHLGKLRLHKFTSNSTEVLNSLPYSETAIEEKDQPLPTLRTLGIRWNMEHDYFTFQNDIKTNPSTRRGVLSTVASIFDPLGFLSPYLLIGKRLLQGLCKENKGWDESLNPEQSEDWRLWCYNLQFLNQLRIPRCLQHPQFSGHTKKIELHSFSDASLDGIGQCSYLKIVDSFGRISTNLIMAKSKVPPQKVITVPRLELVAAVLSVKVTKSILRELDFNDIQVFLWTDSQAVLGYIHNNARKFHTFVSNRVQEIRLDSELSQWNYIKSKENPADMASRGKLLQELVKDQEWLRGPSFLQQERMETSPFTPEELDPEDPEVKRVHTHDTIISQQPTMLVSKSEKFSTWTSLINATSRLLTYIHRLRNLPIDPVDVRKKAKMTVIRQTQMYYLAEDIQELATYRKVSSTSILLKLDPYLDEESILRVGGRLKYSSQDKNIKHPIILPRNSHITKLMLEHCHKMVAHQGRNTTLNQLRSEGFHVIHGTRLVSSMIYKCVACRKLRGRVGQQKMAELPTERTEESPPFTATGFDCFGPFTVKEGRKELKKYGVVFTCLSSRGVHIELLDDLTTDSFINALRCLIAIRGPVKVLLSDRGSNFIGANKEFNTTLQELQGEKLQMFLNRQECKFKFNVPSSSHMGGVWERMIRTIRNIMKGLIIQSTGRLDSSGLRTLFYEIMAIINSRPITYNNPNSTDLEPLTPNHLLTMKTVPALPPPGEFSDVDVYSRKRWRRVQGLAENFWHRWRIEFLANLQKRQKWTSTRQNLKVGDIVYLMDDNKIRNDWRLGKVTKVHTSADGLVRKITVLTANRSIDQTQSGPKQIELERPVTKCIVLMEA